MDNQVMFETVSEHQVRQRLDNYLFRLLKGVPKSHIYRLIRSGQIRVNKKRIKFCYRLQQGDIIRIPPIRKAIERERIQFSDALLSRVKNAIIYEDENMIVVNKPSGIAVHGGSNLSYGMIDIMQTLHPDIKKLELVHRLDKETSGCLMFAKNMDTLRMLHRMLQENGIEKRYLALLKNRWTMPVHYEVDAPISKYHQQSGERLSKISESGKKAKTSFKLLKNYAQLSWVEAYPHTGRTHQIRLHAAYIEHPIVGDTKYGDHAFNKKMDKIGCKRLFLHASSLKLSTKLGIISVKAPLENPLKDFLEQLDNGP